MDPVDEGMVEAYVTKILLATKSMKLCFTGEIVFEMLRYCKQRKQVGPNCRLSTKTAAIEVVNFQILQ